MSFYTEIVNMYKFLDNLTEIMSKKNVTQRKICEICGFTESSFWAWKKGSLPKVDAALKIAQFLGTSVEFLMTGEHPQGITSEEIQLVNKWRLIGDDSRRTALLIIDDAYNRAIAAQKEKKDIA